MGLREEGEIEEADINGHLGWRIRWGPHNGGGLLSERLTRRLEDTLGPYLRLGLKAKITLSWHPKHGGQGHVGVVSLSAECFCGTKGEDA